MFQWLKHHPTGPIELSGLRREGGTHVRSDGDTQSPHVGHVTQGSECLALPKHFMELHTNERVTAKSCLTMFFSSGVTEHLCF